MLSRLVIEVLVLILFVIHLSTAFCETSNLQGSFNRALTLDINQQQLSTVLTEIEKVSGVRFIYSSRLIRSERIVDLNVQDEKLGAVLQNLLGPLKVKFRQEGGHVILVRDRSMH
ncbi:STN domain-containing protein [Dyadobacter sp. LHD-138]|uniref:STN domain-containing protein n=1 Tax=Dyadobacter sp. LHD-138 TaxID=3071413 RepID=UPI0027DF2B36|nr:STN domain-containing protein [Dyadobacter sp. LHD-138]MDQ6478079.1 STN domain-containing protein [Dyadobacter sp. LHD-138]